MLIEDDCLYTEKTHFAAEERLRRLHLFLGLPATLLAAAAAATLIDSRAVLAGVLALTAALFSGAQTFVNPEARATSHHDAAVELARVRTAARLLHSVELLPISTEEAVRRIKDLRSAQFAVNKIAPGASKRDYRVASEKIKQGIFLRDKREGES